MRTAFNKKVGDKDMEKNRKVKGSVIRANVCKETKSAFLDKLHSIKCYHPGLFLAFLLDKWTEREKMRRKNPIDKSFKTLFSLMPADAQYNRMRTGDTIYVYKESNLKRYDWICEIMKKVELSEYNTTSSVCRSLVYAVILATRDLLEELHYSYVMNKIARTSFKTIALFIVDIDDEVYDKLYNMYNITPTSLIYILIKIMLDESSHTRKILLDNINTSRNKYCNLNGNKSIAVQVSNDLLRLKILQLMVDLNFSKKRDFAYALIDLAINIPHVIKEELSSDYYQMDNTDNDCQLEDDMFEKMSNLSYKFDRQ